MNHSIIKKTYTICVCLLLLINSACKEVKSDHQPIKTNPISNLESYYKANLKKSFLYLDCIQTSSDTNERKYFYRQARKSFKLAEPVLSYIDKENYKTLNSPNLLRIQEEDATDIKVRKPIGFQVIEENLFSETPNNKQILIVSKQTSDRIKFIYNNTHLKLKEHNLLWMLRDAILRIATTGLSNFDSPALGQSLKESSFVYNSISQIITIHKDRFNNIEIYNDWLHEIQNSQNLLSEDFDNFDRFNFIQNHTNKQLELWNKTAKDWQVNFPFSLATQNEFNSLFSNEMFNINYFSDHNSDTIYLSDKIALGKQLFNDNKLSANNSMSCATCHIKEKGFTDGRKTFDKNQIRNTPTIAYAGLQKAFFYDNRAGSLEGQIVGVITNHNEFDSNLETLENIVSTDPYYKARFDSLYTKSTTDENIRHAIASYVRTLNKFNSKFDNNLNKTENNLTASEKKGFNLFMGKAACATCHFPPLFNGTVPPNFNESELEIIGVPKSNKNQKLDTDLGRYTIYHTDERKGAFKTPTVRNISKTAPYMHNGAYHTLEEVLDFYNQGGGKGLGFDVPHQTLPFDNLDLSEKEIKDIIAFLKTLSDQ